MADNKDQQLSTFIEMTQSDPEDARAILEASNWNLEQALELHYSGGGADEMQDAAEADEPHDLHQQGRQASELGGQTLGGGRTLGGGSAGGSAGQDASSSSAAQQRRTGGMMTLGELNKPDPKKQNMYAGGEKSGIAVQNPGHQDDQDEDDEEDDGSGQNLIQRILQRAEAGTRSRMEHPEDDEDDAPKSRFTGAGQTLGSDDVPSRTIEDPNASAPQRLPKVTRKLTFWKDGFSIEDGPLMRYDDPQHQETLRQIQSGRAPLSIMNVQPGQPTDLQVFRKMEENYTPPPKKFAPFGGSGQRLGAPTPSGGSSSSAAASSSQTASSASSSSTPARTVDLDSSAPTTNLQIRLGDGTRLVSRFNHTHTVGDVYAFVNASNTQSRTRSYVLQTTFPSKELHDHDIALKDAGLINAVVVQKWN